MSSSPAYSPLLSVWAFRHRCPTMPAADSCTVVNDPCEPFSPESRTPGRPPEVSTTAFTTRLPDLPPRALMVMDFAIISSLVRPGRPHIWFLFVRSWFCYTLPSDPASRRRPCVSLALHHHQVGQGTCTPKLLRMLGALKKPHSLANGASILHSYVSRRLNLAAQRRRARRSEQLPLNTAPQIQTRSIAIAMPWPTPMHIVHNAKRPCVRCS